MSGHALGDIIVKFGPTGQLGVLPGRGRKWVFTAIVENMATAVVEASTESFHGSVSVPNILLTLDMA